jgi:hypothetical protein
VRLRRPLSRTICATSVYARVSGGKSSVLA